MDLDRIEALLKLMREYRVTTLSYEDGGMNVSVSFAGTAPVATGHAPVVVSPAPAPAVAPASAAPVVGAPQSQAGHVVKSPMVGTFYRSAKPGAPSFVEVGQKVKVGQVLCILEAMKLMNELESEVAGTVAEICLENASPVQFGQDLFRIIPD